MGHLPFGGTWKSFLAVLLLLVLSSFRRPSFLRRRQAAARPVGLPGVQPAALA